MASVKKTKKTKKRKQPQPIEVSSMDWENQPVVQRDLSRLINNTDEQCRRIYGLEEDNKVLKAALSKLEGQLDIVVRFAGK